LGAVARAPDSLAGARLSVPAGQSIIFLLFISWVQVYSTLNMFWKYAGGKILRKGRKKGNINWKMRHRIDINANTGIKKYSSVR
jgi:hypothetical protein